MRRRYFRPLAAVLLGLGLVSVNADELASVVRAGLKDQAAEFWLYEDLDAGYAAARKSGKPLLVSFRCVP